MKETFRHREAFEFFYSLGGNPSAENCRKVSEKFHISDRTFWNWYKKFNWKLRVEQRDIENAKVLEKKTNESIIDEKVEIRSMIRTQFNIFKQSLDDYIQKNKFTELKTISDFNQLSNILDRLTRLEMDLLGEQMLSGNLEIKLEKIYMNNKDGKDENNG